MSTKEFSIPAAPAPDWIAEHEELASLLGWTEIEWVDVGPEVGFQLEGINPVSGQRAVVDDWFLNLNPAILLGDEMQLRGLRLSWTQNIWGKLKATAKAENLGMSGETTFDYLQCPASVRALAALEVLREEKKGRL